MGVWYEEEAAGLGEVWDEVEGGGLDGVEGVGTGSGSRLTEVEPFPCFTLR